VILLAMITMAAYGCWIYSFGVLLDPMVADLDARESTLVAAFGAAQLLAGVGSVAAGRLLDRRGSTPVFLLGAAGTAVLVGAGFASSTIGFVVAFAGGAGVLSAAGFYHITQTAAARVSPGRETAAITRLTLYAAFSAPIYYPLTAALVNRFDWRRALELEAAATLVLFVAGALVTRTDPTLVERGPRLGLRGIDARARRYAASVVLAGATIQILSVYQVPMMVAGGLSLATASTLAGARGFAQFAGRLPITRVVSRFGAALTLRASLVTMAVGTALLAVGGSVAVPAAAIIVIGLAVGAESPMVGIRGREVFDERTLGTSLGAVTLGIFIAGAIGPAAAGTLAESTGSRVWAVLAGASVALVAAGVAGRDGRGGS
jgi:MFS family permease